MTVVRQDDVHSDDLSSAISQFAKGTFQGSDLLSSITQRDLKAKTLSRFNPQFYVFWARTSPASFISKYLSLLNQESCSKLVKKCGIYFAIKLSCTHSLTLATPTAGVKTLSLFCVHMRRVIVFRDDNRSNCHHQLNSSRLHRTPLLNLNPTRNVNG